MPYSEVYTHRSGSVSVAQTTALALISVFGTAAKRGWIVGARMEVGNTTAAAGNNMLFQLVRPANTPNASATQGGSAHDFSAPASICVNGIAYTTAPTVGTIVAEWELPQTTGSMWEEFPPTGYEWGIPAIANNNANAGLHMFVTASVNTSTPVFIDLIVSE